MINRYSFKQVVQPKGGFLRGPFGGDLKKEIFVEKGNDTYKVYEQGVVLNSDKNIGRYYVSENDFKAKLHKFSVQNNDFLVSCSGVNMGAIYQLKEPFERGIINQALLRIRLNAELIDDNYFLYLFKELISKKITSGSGDSTIPNFPGLEIIKNIEFELPLKSIQVKIGKILRDLDYKIEINNRINAELEAMAKTLYDYWFVQFDFPNKNGKPYKSSGGKMVWSEELKREIPEGWDALKLLTKFTFEKGVEPGSAEYVEHKESIHHVKFIRVGDVDGSSAIFIDTRLRNYSMVCERDVLVTFDGSVGKVAFGLEGAYSGGLRKIYDKSGIVDSSLIYFIFKDERIIRTIHKYATGSILLHAGSSINNLKIPFREKIYLEYQSKIKSSYDKMVINKKENQKLAELRDWLLPMLMNGQVKVN